MQLVIHAIAGVVAVTTAGCHTRRRGWSGPRPDEPRTFPRSL